MPSFSFDYRPPDAHDHPSVELQRLAAERGVDYLAESFRAPQRRLIEGDEPIPLNDSARLRGLAQVLRCDPRYLIDIAVAHLRATGQEVPADIFVPPPMGIRGKPTPSRVNKRFGAPPAYKRQRPDLQKVTDQQVRAVAHLKVLEACEALQITPRTLRERLRKLGFEPKKQGRPKGDAANVQV
jgi:hypothetical protein